MLGRLLSGSRARRWTLRLLKLQAKRLDQVAMRAPAIVFSPHPDDEVLGCGGTIIQKRWLGAPLRIVFMTDGTKSPPGVPAAELKPLREREALAACQVLGVERKDVTFLGFVDGTLTEQTDAAIDQVTQFLQQHPADQVFVPYYRDLDPGLDHIAANRIVQSALHKLKSRATVYEYPIWFWRYWPRTRIPVQGRPGDWQPEKHSLLPNLRSLADLRQSVSIVEVLELKRTAFSQHKSQAAGLTSMRQTDFLNWFFGNREVFYRHSISIYE